VQVSRILAEIDAEIAKLQQARALLAPAPSETRTGRGRPKGSKNASVKAVVVAKTGKRKLSPEGRKRIADAMRKRWAERRKQNAKS
jgi:surface antigen